MFARIRPREIVSTGKKIERGYGIMKFALEEKRVSGVSAERKDVYALRGRGLGPKARDGQVERARNSMGEARLPYGKSVKQRATGTNYGFKRPAFVSRCLFLCFCAGLHCFRLDGAQGGKRGKRAGTVKRLGTGLCGTSGAALLCASPAPRRTFVTFSLARSLAR